jgi:hypothetical protein
MYITILVTLIISRMKITYWDKICRFCFDNKVIIPVTTETDDYDYTNESIGDVDDYIIHKCTKDNTHNENSEGRYLLNSDVLEFDNDAIKQLVNEENISIVIKYFWFTIPNE